MTRDRLAVVYDHFPNFVATGNGGQVQVRGSGRHGLPASAETTIPANGLIVLTGS